MEIAEDFDSELFTRELFQEHSELIGTDPILFRKRVIRHLRNKTGWEREDAAQEYNKALRWFRDNDPKFVQPLFDADKQKKTNKRNKVTLQPDELCYSVIEVLSDGTVGRCQSFLTREEAEPKYVSKCSLWPAVTWVLIRGLGPNSGDNYRLDTEEEELVKHTPVGA